MTKSSRLHEREAAVERLSPVASLCWMEKEKDGLVLHCTEPAGHEGNHWHAYSKTAWPSPSTQTAALPPPHCRCSPPDPTTSKETS
ncbi:hypothetical protein JIX56_29425 [Streptomyces sp. CA-210063]|uniref:hypothetical protein n=1 Tax=Streptomyces sp. CA-210063 TaxID=2801029 RepID=UPI00214CF522|nr:hypothetical protein [Streptomyces sp. CA-210063]UUU33639.1 hypothetical protein JIX56_29425 [Streptomyces sp. CA-210063]